MTSLELRGNAMLAELKALVNALTDRCAVMAADLAQAQEKIQGLEAKLADKEKPVFNEV